MRMAGLFEQFEVNRDPRWPILTKLVSWFASAAPRTFVGGHLRACVARHR